MPAGTGGHSTTAWLILGMTAAKISAALSGVKLTRAEIEELLGREAGDKNGRFVMNLLEARLAELSRLR